MGEIIQEESGKKKGGKRRPKKHSTHIDMTPMVDLMCLLITFFMLTTAFSKPKAMEIVLPEKKKTLEKQQEIPEARTFNILIGAEDKVFWYVGKIDPKKPLPALNKTDFSKDGLRKVLLERNKDLYTKIDEFREKVKKGVINIPRDSIKSEERKLGKKDDSGPIVLIKADPETAKYKNIVDVIDEMAITNIVRYAIVDIASVEIDFMNGKPINYSAAQKKK
jgi:biopolymer transport protein ExbD